jgi:hypothetical protein
MQASKYCTGGMQSVTGDNHQARWLIVPTKPGETYRGATGTLRNQALSSQKQQLQLNMLLNVHRMQSATAPTSTSKHAPVQ